jgi:hypothetical protein
MGFPGVLGFRMPCGRYAYDNPAPSTLLGGDRKLSGRHGSVRGRVRLDENQEADMRLPPGKRAFRHNGQQNARSLFFWRICSGGRYVIGASHRLNQSTSFSQTNIKKYEDEKKIHVICLTLKLEQERSLSRPDATVRCAALCRVALSCQTCRLPTDVQH